MFQTSDIELQSQKLKLNIPYLFEYKSHFFVPENQSKKGGATYTRGYVKWPAKITTA